jgi:hypothetical protein
MANSTKKHINLVGTGGAPAKKRSKRKRSRVTDLGPKGKTRATKTKATRGARYRRAGRS